MKTLEKFNTERRAIYDNMDKPIQNGIACPQCGTEMVDSNPGMLLMSNPPQKNIHCNACGFRGYRIA